MKRFVSILILVVAACVCLVAAADGSLTAVTCAKEGFATMIPSDCAAQYTQGTGLQIFTEHPGYIPYIIISRRPADKQFSNPRNYLNNVYREYMENQYGDKMLGTNPAKDWEIGGKTLLGARYLYKVGDTTVCLLQLIELREDGDVEYSAKFIDGDDARTMSVLYAAVKYYTVEPAAAEPQPAPANTETPRAAPADTVAPADMSGLEVDTEYSIYWAAITDTDQVENGGFFTARLYLQDLYQADRIDSLAEGAKVIVNSQEYTVASVIRHDDGTIEIYPKEEFDGYIAFRKASDYFYTALVNDWVPCTHIADMKIMLPLANDFSFTRISGDDQATIYDADSFIAQLDEGELTQYNTTLQFSGGLVMAIIHTSYPFGPEAD